MYKVAAMHWTIDAKSVPIDGLECEQYIKSILAMKMSTYVKRYKSNQQVISQMSENGTYSLGESQDNAKFQTVMKAST